ncbi:MAG TPA: HAMP domain-containing sensor histidine kinase [Acidimicrobiales bacterium]|nr:HAMP domain-containing sensor histidine kinase [Acidimicrobiales bacterium]
MRNRLLLGFILFSILATSILLVPIGFTLESHENANTLTALKHDATAFSTFLVNDLKHNRVKQAVDLARSYAFSTKRQILVTDKAGVLIATKKAQSKDATLLKVVKTVGRTEIYGVTSSTALGGSQYYVSMKLPHATNASGSINHVVLTVTYPVKVVAKTIHSDWRNLGLYGLLILIAACLFGLVVSDSLARPLKRIGKAVEAIGSGQLDVRAPVTAGPVELRRLAESINATAARLITLLEAQRSFVEDASHQLRTPLTALQLHLENLQHSTGGDASEDLAAVLAEVGRLNRLVDSLLALARNESRSPILIPVNLHRVVLERVEYWKPFADERQLELTANVDSALEVAAIEGVMEQVLDNLLSNAFDATPPGGRVRVSAIQTPDDVEVHVTDSGSGLEPRERELALRRFWRGRTSSDEGSGLGLSIVVQLIRLSGGSFELRDATEGGIDATIVFGRA